MTIQLSEFRNEHLRHAVGLLNDEYRGNFEFIPYDEERIASYVRRWNLKVLVAEENNMLLGLIGVRLEERSEDDIFWLAAKKGSRQETVMGMLVNAVEKTARSNTISAGIDEGSPRIAEWIKRGYTLNPGWLRMSAKLTGSKTVPETAKGIILRSLREGEEQQLIEVMNTGFGWRRLEPGAINGWKTEDPPFTEDWVQVAETSGTIVSAVVAKPDTDYNKFFHLKRGHLGPAATLPEHRSKHLASALTVKAMNFLYEKGMKTARLGTSELNVPSITLLQNIGFHVDSVRKVLRKNLGTDKMAN
jgi:ribosomal protein S18 acetylase RimI-like enzyme